MAISEKLYNDEYQGRCLGVTSVSKQYLMLFSHNRTVKFLTYQDTTKLLLVIKYWLEVLIFTHDRK